MEERPARPTRRVEKGWPQAYSKNRGEEKAGLAREWRIWKKERMENKKKGIAGKSWMGGSGEGGLMLSPGR